MVAVTRAKRKAAEAEASRTGDLPEQPKLKPKRRRAHPPGLEAILQRTTPCLITKETEAFSLSHTLRSGRNLWFPKSNTAKPPGPMRFKKGEEALYDTSWRTPACARIALKYYNRLNEDKLELVKAVDSIEFFFNGHWMHANFLAKSEGGTSCAELVPKFFFAELKVVPGHKKMACVSLIQMDQGNPGTRPVRGCRICPSQIFHPAAGRYIGARRQGAGRQASNVDAMANA